MNNAIATLLSLQKTLRKQETFAELSFFMAHQTRKLYYYENAVVWSSINEKKVTLLSISGVTQIDKFTPFYQTVVEIISTAVKTLKKNKTTTIITWKFEDFPEKIKSEWPFDDNCRNLVFMLYVNHGVITGGIMFIHSKPISEEELEWLHWIHDPYQYSWTHLSKKTSYKRRLRSFFLRKRMFVSIVIIALLALLFFRLPISVIAPAVIEPKDPQIIASPMEGVISEVLVKPNEKVEKGQLLFEIDKQDLINANELAQKELDTAQAKYLRAVQTGFKDVKERSEINVLKAQAKAKELEYEYTSKLLKKAEVEAPESGIVILDNADRWVGKPVITGEKVLEVANPKHVEIDVWLPASDDINFSKGDKVKVFLNNRPLSAIEAHVAYASVNAEITAQGVLAYRVVAYLSSDQDLPRIGSQGSAKLISQEKVSLFYYLFRRPIATLRQTLGW